jgi:hypothetical protein
MPTGYTADIADGITFQKFAMNCARAFGALIALRDEPAGAEIPEFKPSAYYDTSLAEARERLTRLLALTPDEAEDEALRAHLNAEEARAKYAREKEALRLKYEAMLADVEAWRPPTPDHQGLKNFMREQITESIRFDCGESAREGATKQAGAEWLAAAIADAERSVAYHAKSRDEEHARVAERNAWVRALRASLT